MHNTYFTLPVVLLMISNHYSFMYNHEYAWVLMSLFIFAGALIRQFFVLMHAGKIQPAYPAVGAALIAVTFWVGMPANSASDGAESGEGPSLAEVETIIESRCASCHSASPSQEGFGSAPAGVIYDTTSQIEGHRAKIQEVVASNYMPLGNMTGMTDEEREIIADWSE